MEDAVDPLSEIGLNTRWDWLANDTTKDNRDVRLGRLSKGAGRKLGFERICQPVCDGWC